jgi:hypothetical protein
VSDAASSSIAIRAATELRKIVFTEASIECLFMQELFIRFDAAAMRVLQSAGVHFEERSEGAQLVAAQA